MPDASRLIEFADRHGRAWRWKTVRKGQQWEGRAQLDPQDGRPAPIFSSGELDDEQEALDRAIEHAIEHDRWQRRPVGTSSYGHRARD